MKCIVCKKNIKNNSDICHVCYSFMKRKYKDPKQLNEILDYYRKNNGEGNETS